MWNAVCLTLDSYVSSDNSLQVVDNFLNPPKGLGESNPFWFLSISIKPGEATPENMGHAYKR